MCDTAAVLSQSDRGNKEEKTISASTFVRSLTVTLSDDTVTNVDVAQHDVGEEGVIVWDAALVLAYFLERHQLDLKLGEAVHVLELGAGTGAVGLVAAALGARVTLTDLDRLVPLLQESISLNRSLKGSVSARSLHWGQESHIGSFKEDPPDLILVADCVYYSASLEPLIKTLASLSSLKGCPVLLSYEVRDDFEDKRQVKEKFFDLAKNHFQVREIATADCHPDFAADDIKVVRLEPIKN